MPIYLQALLCRGTESRLVDCRHSGVGVVSSFCGHDDDAGVICPNVPCKSEMKVTWPISTNLYTFLHLFFQFVYM